MNEIFKQAEIIMLPSNKEPIRGDLLLRYIWKNNPKLECNSLWQYKESDIYEYGTKVYRTLGGSFEDWHTAFDPQYLYIVSDDEVKEGDYGLVYCMGIKGVGKGYKVFFHDGTKITKLNAICNGTKKMIATTDSSLINRRLMTFQDETTEYVYYVPQLSQEFIENYIKAYNQKQTIIDVLVEYEEIFEENWSDVEDEPYEVSFIKLKINSDNTINIKL